MLRVYHHSLQTVCAVPWVLAKISTQEINPPKVRGTNCFMDAYISPTSEVTASAQKHSKQTRWEPESRQFQKAREERMQDAFPPPCAFLSFEAYLTLPEKKSDSNIIKNLPLLFFFLLAYFWRLLLQQLHLKIPGARPLVYYHQKTASYFSALFI